MDLIGVGISTFRVLWVRLYVKKNAVGLRVMSTFSVILYTNEINTNIITKELSCNIIIQKNTDPF